LAFVATTSLAGVAAAGQDASAPIDANGCEPTQAMPVPQPTQAQLDAAGLGDLDLAPDSARRDLSAAPFSNPAAVTNTLFPIADLRSAILNGHVDGEPFYTETTLLPFTHLIEWTPGQCIRVLASQYTAFLDGRLTEVAIDLYAQDDDGSVWYLGEDVQDYDPQGRIVTDEGTWHAGIEGTAAMIMPSDPQVGDANRAENIPGTVFEEVVITAVGRTFDGPSGPVEGGIVGTETHEDGTKSDKLFAPGYGEFRSTDGSDVEALALASPTDALPGGVPAELTQMASGADRIFATDPRSARDWQRTEEVAAAIFDAWQNFRQGDVPPRLERPTDGAVGELLGTISHRNGLGTLTASVDVAYASANLQLRYRPVTEIDTIRFDLWARRALVDALAGALGGVRSDVATLEWVRDRIAPSIDAVTLTRLDALVGDAGEAVFEGDLAGARAAARDLVRIADRLVS
jgi:hypothetical protein